MVKNPPANGGDTRHKLSLGLEDPLEKEMVTTPVTLLVNPMNRRAWRAIIHEITKGLDVT